jgi:uncharacterized DUF497 family protein
LPWTWDPEKNRSNIAKHGISFETAQLVFDDRLAGSRLDPYPREERWQTIGKIGHVTIVVIHTIEVDPVTDEEDGQIISARKAEDHERKAYEEGEWD